MTMEAMAVPLNALESMVCTDVPRVATEREEHQAKASHSIDVVESGMAMEAMAVPSKAPPPMVSIEEPRVAEVKEVLWKA